VVESQVALLKPGHGR